MFSLHTGIRVSDLAGMNSCKKREKKTFIMNTTVKITVFSFTIQ